MDALLIVFLQILKRIWASPNTLLGLIVGALGFLFGGKCQVVRGCVEFHGGLVAWLLRRTPTGPTTMAMTLGHTIIGQTESSLALARDHEHVHVRQYERWGPFFIPAYLGWSAVLWWQGKDAYLDNPFEVEAYSKADVQLPDDE